MNDACSISIDLGEIAKLPYIKQFPKLPRQIPILPYFDHSQNKYFIWFNIQGKLIEHKLYDVVQGEYISQKPISPDEDILLPFTEVIYRHFSLGEIIRKCRESTQDFINGLGFIEKYFILLYHYNVFSDTSVSNLVSIELESAFGNHRSFYDIVHEIIRETYQAFSSKKCQLPDSFRKMVQMDASEMEAKYYLPKSIVQFYLQKKDLFMACRAIRDAIYHSGVSFTEVFALNDGFAISADNQVFNHLAKLVSLWPTDKLKPNRLASILPVLCLLVENMFDTMQSLGACIVNAFQSLPEPIFKDNHIYLRSPFARHLHRLRDYKQIQWLCPDIALKEYIEKGSEIL